MAPRFRGGKIILILRLQITVQIHQYDTPSAIYKNSKTQQGSLPVVVKNTILQRLYDAVDSYLGDHFTHNFYIKVVTPFREMSTMYWRRQIPLVIQTFEYMSWTIQYIPRNMHTVFALLCFVVVIHWLIFPYPSGLLHWHCGNLTIAPVPAKQPWWIWINTSCEFIMNDCITTTKQSTTNPCAYFLGYNVISKAYSVGMLLCPGAPFIKLDDAVHIYLGEGFSTFRLKVLRHYLKCLLCIDDVKSLWYYKLLDTC